MTMPTTHHKWAVFGGALLVTLLAGAVDGQTSRPARRAPASAPAPTATSAKPTPNQFKVNLAYQIALDKVDFSPGVIDGKFGPKSALALKEYAASKFPGVDVTDKRIFDALKVDVDSATVKYTITADDAAMVGPLPEDWNEKAKLTTLPYPSLAEMVAEKFRCSQSLLIRLNPGLTLNSLDVGQELTVPNVEPFLGPASAAAAKANSKGAAYISINLTEKAVRAYDSERHQLCLFHCSVARDKAKLPAADTKVKVMAANPNYTFDPKHWPEVQNVDRILTIPPGPRNPVGVIWIGLELPGYGMHGVPKPELIGKTGSHGCFRLTNWDAVKVYSYVSTGMLVKIVNPEKPDAPDTE